MNNILNCLVSNHSFCTNCESYVSTKKGYICETHVMDYGINSLKEVFSVSSYQWNNEKGKPYC